MKLGHDAPSPAYSVDCRSYGESQRGKTHCQFGSRSPTLESIQTGLGGGRPSCFRLAASSSHVSPRAANRSLMWPSARFRRSANVPGLSSADTQKSLKNCRTTSRRRSISCLLGEASDVMSIWWLSGRTTTLSATGSSSAMVSTVSLGAFGSELPFH